MAKEKGVEKKQLKFSLGQELELRFGVPGKTWNVIIGEDVKEVELFRKHALVDKKGSTIGQVEHRGLARLVNEPATGKTYVIGDVNCTHKFSKSGKTYVIDGAENMKQEVMSATVQERQLLPGVSTQFVGDPIFSNLRTQYCTQDGAPQPVVAVKSPINNSGRYIIHFTPWRQLCKPGFQ